MAVPLGDVDEQHERRLEPEERSGGEREPHPYSFRKISAPSNLRKGCGTVRPRRPNGWCLQTSARLSEDSLARAAPLNGAERRRDLRVAQRRKVKGFKRCRGAQRSKSQNRLREAQVPMKIATLSRPPFQTTFRRACGSGDVKHGHQTSRRQERERVPAAGAQRRHTRSTPFT